ncbi:MAG: hypothetical protein ACR2GU_01880 [Rubrobacteraceae bacterium]|jgi:predicted PhzF superfamily epimerase YddE/YHI9
MPSLEIVADVPAEEKYSSNRLTVVQGAEDLPDAVLQKTASETNCPEHPMLHNCGRTNE